MQASIIPPGDNVAAISVAEASVRNRPSPPLIDGQNAAGAAPEPPLDASDEQLAIVKKRLRAEIVLDRKSIRESEKQIAELLAQRKRIVQEHRDTMAYVHEQIAALNVDAYFRSAPLSEILSRLNSRFGVATVREGLAKPGAPKEDVSNLIALWATVTACSRAANTDAKRACRLISHCGGYPKSRSTREPLAKPSFDTPTSVLSAYNRANRIVRTDDDFQRQAAERTADGIFETWEKSGKPIARFLTDWLRRQHELAAGR